VRSYIGVADAFVLSSRMGHCAGYGRTNLLRIFPQRASSIAMLARLPVLFTARKFLNCDIRIQPSGLGIDGDDVAVLQEANRAAELGFGANMADAKTAGGAGEAPVGDERHL